MPLTRFKLTAIGDDGISSAKLAHSLDFDGTHIRIPHGTTAERPSSPESGYLRFNTTLDQLEQYTADSGWQGISPPPVVTSINVNNLEGDDDPQTLVITGTNFDTTATGVLVDANGATVTPTTSTRNNSTQLTITFSGSDVLDNTTAEPLDVKITNGSGLTATLEQALNIDAVPAWSTSAGSLGTAFVDDAISTITVAATDPEGESVSYSLTSGALPVGLSLNSANGEITGTPTATSTNYSSSGVTENFTITADDGTGNTVPRAFSILKKWNDGSSANNAARSVREIYKDTDGAATSATPTQYYLDPTGAGSGSAFQVYGVESLASLGTVPSGTSAHFKNLRGLNVVTYNNLNSNVGAANESDYLISETNYYKVLEGLHGIRASGYTGSIYWATVINGTLDLITRCHFNQSHSTFKTSTESPDGGGNIDNDFSNHASPPTQLQALGQACYWDVWDKNYTVTNFNGLNRAIPYRGYSNPYSSQTSYGLHFKRLSSGEHYPWHGGNYTDANGDPQTYANTDYMTSGGYRYYNNTLTDAQAIAAGHIDSGGIHYGSAGTGNETERDFINKTGYESSYGVAGAYVGDTIKMYFFLHEGTDDT